MFSYENGQSFLFNKKIVDSGARENELFRQRLHKADKRRQERTSLGKLRPDMASRVVQQILNLVNDD